jgi:hypothetical protein
MAILHRKEEKIQIVLGRLPKKYDHEQFVEMFIKLYSKDWGKIKAAYIKQSQDREPGTVVHMPKPDLYLKQILEIYLSTNVAEVAKEAPVKASAAPVVKTKAAPKKATVVVTEEKPVKKTKATAKKKADTDDQAEIAIKPKAAPKKKLAVEEKVEPVKEVKKKAPAKKKTETEEIATVKVKKAKATEK